MPLDQADWTAPYREPGQIWGVGLNYQGHASDLRTDRPAEEPGTYLRPTSTIIGPGEAIRIPPDEGAIAAEAELGVIIGRTARDLTPRDAASAIFGYVPLLDMTAEDLVRRNPRFIPRAKAFDTFCSFGPTIVTADEIVQPDKIRIATVHNGETVSSACVSDAAFHPFDIVALLSRTLTLHPGDLIATGTPGAAKIRPGDTVSAVLDGFRTLTNRVVAG